MNRQGHEREPRGSAINAVDGQIGSGRVRAADCAD
jgi:hypothetical protein